MKTIETNTVLTVAIAKELKGKKIACTSAEYKYNTPHITELVVGDIVSEWDYMATQPCDGYHSRQDWWASYMTEKQIDEKKTTLCLLNSDGKLVFKAHTKYFNFYDEPTFTGSDADREVYFSIIN